MSGQSTLERAEQHTIQLLVHGESDRVALGDLLDERYDILDDEAVQPVDCYLVSDRTFPVYCDELQELKEEGHPTFTPVLLVQQEESNGTVPLPSEQNDDGPPLIDEVVSAPVDRVTLVRRVENLLARREQSLELSQRYEDAKTRFQKLFNSTNDAIFVVGPTGQEITECNPAAADLLGYTRDELLSVAPTQTIHADERARFQSFLGAVQETGTGSADDLRCQTKDGETRRLDVSAATLEESDGSPIIVSARDVTERKAYERELELKSRAMDEAPIGITITDHEQEDNPMVYVNDGFAEVTGYPAEEALGRNCRFLQGEATREEPVTRMREAVNAAEPVSVELRNYRKDGSQFWNRVSIAPVRDDTGTVTNYIGFQQDVTERKEREQTLQLFRKAVENAGQSVFITDREGTIEYVNPVFEQRTGYTREEAVGQTPRILKSGKHDDEFYEQLWETLLAGKQWDGHLINQRKNGELYHVDETVSPITNGGDEITHFVAIKADVTNRRLREQQLEVLNRLLRHNLRNGTNVIQGRATVLQDLLDDEELQTNVTEIEHRADALATLGDKANTVRSLFESDPQTETPYDVTELLTEVVAKFSEANPTASVTLGEVEAVSVRADSRLEMAMTELLDNAIVHNESAVPEVTVSVRPASEKGAKDWAEIEITDNGPGIPDHEQETIERGEETSLQHGTGLGLWIVYWTVSLFGGEISIQDNEPRGTRVTLMVPRASEKGGDERSDTRHQD
ncbi:PAS domain S-box protein [Halovenus salina]|uniref:PAS domain S-box protein n=1 Tax=Halovenus salina TaxID=1510225 RepID=A0ABD5W0W5_9EURY|nr:PAS domain S-box protein [Halovenus salina]